MRATRPACVLAGVAVCGLTLTFAPVAAGAETGHPTPGTMASSADRIKHVVVIDLENKDFETTFGADSPAHYLNDVLLNQGMLIENYYATSHVSMGNYISQISGQATTAAHNNDCLDLSTLAAPPVRGAFTDIVPATPTADGQVIGDGCVFPSTVKTIGDQLDARYGGNQHRGGNDPEYVYPWRLYAEDMGNIPARDHGVIDPMGGTDCAHPPIGSVDTTNSAAPGDRYATRHNPFVYFHSIIDDQDLCNERVVPLGTLTAGQGGAPDTFTGHLAEDLKHKKTTPAFAFVVPDLCNDAHDDVCKPADVGGTATDVEGGTAGGLVAADLWLKHWIPMLMHSPAYQSGEMLIVVTFDEAEFSSPTSNLACCDQIPGPNQAGNPGFSPVLARVGLQPAPTRPGQYPGGGKIGAVLLNKTYIVPGSRNTTGEYNHYSALKSYEELLGLDTGGTDGQGHLGYAAVPGLEAFGPDVFNRSSHD